MKKNKAPKKVKKLTFNMTFGKDGVEVEMEADGLTNREMLETIGILEMKKKDILELIYKDRKER